MIISEANIVIVPHFKFEVVSSLDINRNLKNLKHIFFACKYMFLISKSTCFSSQRSDNLYKLSLHNDAICICD